MVTQSKSAKRAAETAEAPVDLDSPKLYINRSLSLLEYQQRLLGQARDARHPLLERIRFTKIVSDNLDEFFMVRVSDLLDELDAGVTEMAPDAMTPTQQLAAIRKKVISLLEGQRRIVQEQLLPELEAQGVRIVSLGDLTTSQRAGLRTYYDQQIFPVITPLAVDHGHPWPHISNLSVNLAVELQGEGETLFARVKIPDVFPRLLHVESILGQHVQGKKAKYTFVWLDDLVAHNLSTLFAGVPVLAWHSFRVVRDADIEIHEEEGVDLRATMERGLRERRFGETVALFVENDMPETMRTLLCQRLNVSADNLYPLDKPLGLTSLDELTSIDRPELKYPRFVPRTPARMTAGEPMTTTVDRHDVLLYHPYESFAPVVELLAAAARDPNVLAIKATLYRVGPDSPIVQALLDAVNHGKQVAVLVELKARFDEASNIEWARELETAGVHVVYGFVGLKTHAKVALIVRKDRTGIRRYVHVGTGNYNPGTARAYTDLGLITAHPDFGADATDLFNYLTGYSQQTSYRQFLVAPLGLRDELIERVEREIARHETDGKGHIIFKLNNLLDKDSMQALYRASQAGVQVDLIVRTVCGLRPKVPGVSENIRVISIVGRFLEHSRIYYFRNGGTPEMFAGSADLMARNLDHRVEVLFPVLDADVRDRIVRDILEPQLRDTVNAWEQQPDGTYTRLRPRDGEEPFDSQAWSITHGA